MATAYGCAGISSGRISTGVWRLRTNYLPSPGHSSYEVHPDNQRFVMVGISAEVENTQLILVENWAEELRDRVPN